MTVTLSPLAALLAQARRNNQPLPTVEDALIPADKEAAFLVQQDIMRLTESATGGWKVGSKSHNGPIQGSPLPTECLFPSGHDFQLAHYPQVGLELEIAFRFNRAFEPRSEPYSDEEVLASIGAMAATIEVVSSRYADFPRIDPLLQLADLLNHGALVVGEFVPYQPGFDFAQPALDLQLNGASIVPSAVANPAGDPRRLLPWLVNHHTTRGIALPADQVITTGSYTGMHFAQEPGEVTGSILGLPPLTLSLS